MSPRDSAVRLNAARTGPKVRAVGLAAFVGRDVELHTHGGGAFRGELVSVDDGWLRLVRHSGYEVLIPVSALSAVLDEQRLPASERERDG